MVSRLHLMFRFEESAVAEIAALRHCWDPMMAAKVPPHVTLTYPRELNDHTALVERGVEAAAAVSEFCLAATQMGTADDDGAGGIWMQFHDTSGSWAALRELIVPDSQIKVGPHMTIVHPRTSNQGPAAWPELQGWRTELTLTVDEFVLTATEADESNEILHRFPLRRD